jgi:hypothetical protein
MVRSSVIVTIFLEISIITIIFTVCLLIVSIILRANSIVIPFVITFMEVAWVLKLLALHMFLVIAPLDPYIDPLKLIIYRACLLWFPSSATPSGGREAPILEVYVGLLLWW